MTLSDPKPDYGIVIVLFVVALAIVIPAWEFLQTLIRRHEAWPVIPVAFIVWLICGSPVPWRKRKP